MNKRANIPASLLEVMLVILLWIALGIIFAAALMVYRACNPDSVDLFCGGKVTSAYSLVPLVFGGLFFLTAKGVKVVLTSYFRRDSDHKKAKI
jgi:hypothetical protein